MRPGIKGLFTERFGGWGIYAQHLGGYMRRWILRTPLFTIRLHRILTSDAGRDLHDHPFNFTSLILRGGYLEHRPGCACVEIAGSGMHGLTENTPCRIYRPRAMVRRRAEDLHRLELLYESEGALTLVFGGRYRRAWGFQTPDGWMPQEAYHRTLYGEQPRPVPVLPEPSAVGADAFWITCPNCNGRFGGARDSQPADLPFRCTCGTSIQITWPEKQ